MHTMHNLLVTKVFSCFLAYLIAIIPFINSTTYAAKPRTLIPPNPPLEKGGVRADFTPLDKGGRVELRGTSEFPPLVKGGKGGFSDEANKEKLLSAYMKMPMSFIKNQGQMDEMVKFYEKGSGHTTFFTKDGTYLALSQGSGVRSKR